MSHQSHQNKSSVYDIPNTLVARDNKGSTWLSGVILKGADYLSKNVDPKLTKEGYLYFYSNDTKQYALLKNLGENDNLHISLDLKTEDDGKFSIRTISKDGTKANSLFSVEGDRVLVNNDLDVVGSATISQNLNVNGSLYYSKTILNSCNGFEVVNINYMKKYIDDVLTENDSVGPTGPQG